MKIYEKINKKNYKKIRLHFILTLVIFKKEDPLLVTVEGEPVVNILKRYHCFIFRLLYLYFVFCILSPSLSFVFVFVFSLFCVVLSLSLVFVLLCLCLWCASPVVNILKK